MDIAARKLRDFYDHQPGAAIVQEEFGFFTESWKRQGHIGDRTDLHALFGLDRRAVHGAANLGWCEAALCPAFEEAVLEDRGDYELVRDFAGRTLLCFKGRRSGFMPEYLDHPVKDETSLDAFAFRLDPDSPERYIGLEARCTDLLRRAEEGDWIQQRVIGGYMYLRSLIGPERLLFTFYDDPALIHRCMELWLNLADKVTARWQERICFDEVFLAEDICYNGGCLISPVMMKEFLFPYYQQLLENIKRRRGSEKRPLVVQVDTDGNCLPVIDLYREQIGMNYMSPFEAAAGCDVVAVRKKYPDLLIRGGFDKRILAAGKEAIRQEVERVMPFMVREGGYIPSCDHGVPDEVAFDDYLYYRELMREY